MSDLISRQAAIDIVVFECGKWTGLAKEISKQLKQLPSAQPTAEPVRHGKWIGYAGTIGNECSVCGKWIDVLQGTAEMNYCPNCGARMDKDE